MKIICVEKFPPKKLNRTTPNKPPIHLRRNDWEALMQHDRLTGKLDMRGKEVIRDPSSVKRLLEAEMIDPDGKLTSKAREKCNVLAQKLNNSLLGSSATPQLPGEDTSLAPATKKIEKMTLTVWAVLMKYDRQTGNLLRVDPETGLLDDTSRAILKKPPVIQRLIEKNLILPGGWLTPEAKERCARIEKKQKVQSADGSPAPQSKGHSDSKVYPEIKDHLDVKNRRDDADTKDHHQSKSEPMSQGEPQSKDNFKARIYSAYDRQDAQDLQAFFENLPDDVPESGLDPEIYFAYDWQDERDLQAYFENLPQHFSDPKIIARPGQEFAPRVGRGAGNSQRGVRSKHR